MSDGQRPGTDGGPGTPSLTWADSVGGAVRAHRARLVASYFFQAMAGVLPLVQVYLLTGVVDALVAGRTSVGPLLVEIAGMLACGLAGVWSQFLASRLTAEASSAIVSSLQVGMFRRLLTMPVQFYTTVRPGAVVSRLTNDVNVAETRFTKVLPTMVSSITSIVVSVVIVGLVDPRFIAFLVLVPVAVHYVRKAEARINENISRSFEVTSRLASAAETFVASDGVLLARQAGRTAHEAESFARNTRELARLNVSTTRAGALAVTCYGTAFVVIGAGALLLAVWLIGQQGVTVGSLVLVVLYLQQLQGPVQSLLGTRYPRMRANIAFDRIAKVLAVRTAGTPAGRRPAPAGTTAEMTVSGVTYTYPDTSEYTIDGLSHAGEALSISWLPMTGLLGDGDRDEGSAPPAPGVPVLRDVSFEVRRGETVAVVGPSGAGKSTLALICAGLVPADGGQVLLGGLPIGSRTEEELTSSVAYISQETFVLHATVRENLTYMAPEATQEELLGACRVARLDDVVDGLENGLDTVIGEKGYRLSGGERQRLAIARAVLRRPQLVVLDEPTSHLDNETESAVRTAVREAFADAAVILIAHRLTTVRDADRILVMSDGEIVESGPHDELAARPDGVYRSLLSAGAV